MQEHGNLGTAGRVRMDTELDAIAKLLIDFVVVSFLLGKLGKRHEALLQQVLLEESGLLECLTRNVQWQILRVDNALDNVQPPWHEFIAIIQDKHTADVQLGADVW